MPQAYADVAEIVWYTDESASPATVLKPAAFGPGDLLLVAIFQDTSNLSTLTGPSGWTEEENASSQIGNCGKVWSHVYDGAEPSTWDFGYGASDGAAIALIRVVHADVTTPAIVAAVPTMTSSNSSSMASPTVTPTGNHDLLLCLVSCRCSGSTFSYTAPSGMADDGFVQVPGGWAAIAVGSEQLAAPGATGTRTWTGLSPTGQQSSALSIAVKDSGLFDPDPPRIPPLPTVSESLLNALLAAKGQKFDGSAGTAWIQERLSVSAVNAAATVITAAGTKAGDVLYCFHGSDWSTAAGLTTPTGTAGTWTLEATGDNGTNSAHIKVWRRVVAVDGPQTVTVLPAFDEEVWNHLVVVGGADTTNPTDVAAGSNGAASTAHVAPSVTPTSPNPLLLCAAQSVLNPASYTPPPGMDELTDLQAAGVGSSSLAREVLAVTGSATGTRTFTNTSSQAWATVSVAIRAGSGQPPPTGGGAVTASDTAAATDAVTRSLVLARTSADTAAATDTAARALVQTRPAAETSAATDAATRSVTQSRPVADAAAATDATSRSLTQSRTAPSTAAATDTAAGSVIGGGQSRTASDTAIATDAASRALVLARTAADAAVATDAATRTSARARTAADTAAAADAAIRSLTVSRPVADTAAAADAATRSSTRTRAVSDTAAATDAATGVLGGGQARSAADTAAATDTAARAAQTFSRTAPSTAAATDSAVRAVARFRTISDTAAATDAAVKSLARTRTATDASAASDTATRAPQSFSRTAVDTALAADAVIGAQSGGITFRPFTGTTARPNSGTTARPSSGTTARPGSGITVRPFTGTTNRP